MQRYDIINMLIYYTGAKKYLEIGYATGTTFKKVVCKSKVSVDPNSTEATHQTTSDKFFANNKEKFDIIFIDGLHHAEQVYKDIINALSCLNNNGVIVCHDLLPPSEEYQIVPPIQNLWTGDCWKAWVKIRSEKSDLFMYTVDTDFGCGIISRGNQTPIDLKDNEVEWHNFVKNKKEWMNIISVQQFQGYYNVKAK